jgi:tRNA (guanine-N7-)-methyltransferase
MELNRIEEFPAILAKSDSKQRIELEIGCGNGHFISKFAGLHKDRFFIGVEVKKDRCIKIVKKLERANLDNVAIVYGRAEELLDLFPPGSLDAIRVYFPDPWPKTKHRKKRLLRKPIIDIIASSLKIDGRLCFATDFFDYSVQVKLLVLLAGCFSLADKEPPDEVFLSIFATKFTNANRPIYFIDAIKITEGRIPK